MDLQAPTPDLLFRCMKAARLDQRGLAHLLGISDRTVSRYLGGGVSVLMPAQFHALARAVFPSDPALAAECARLGSTTLEAIGLGRPPAVAPAVAVAPSASAVGPATPAVSAATLDSIVCSAADLSDLPSRQVRPMVAAAFARAVELGLSAEAVASGFAAKPKKA